MTEVERLDAYADAIHGIAVILRESGATPSQKSQTLRGIGTILTALSAQLIPTTPLKEAV